MPAGAWPGTTVTGEPCGAPADEPGPDQVALRQPGRAVVRGVGRVLRTADVGAAPPRRGAAGVVVGGGEPGGLVGVGLRGALVPLGAGRGRGAEHQAEVRRAVARDHRESACHHRRIGDQHLLDAVHARDGDLADGDQVGEQPGERGPVVLQQPVELGGGDDAPVEHGAQVGVGLRARQRLGQVGEVGGERADRRAGLALGVQDDRAVLDQGDGLGQGVGGGQGQPVAGVEQPLQVAPAAGERLAQLGDHDLEVLLVHRVHQPVEVEQQRLGGHGGAGALAGDDVAAGEEGGRGRGRLQVEVLLAHRRAVLDDGVGVGGHLRPAVHPQVDAHAVALEPQGVDPAGGDAAVGDLGALEDAAGLGQVDRHHVGPSGDDVAEPDVPQRHVGDADDGDEGEGDQLVDGGAGDHVSTPPSRRAASSGS